MKTKETMEKHLTLCDESKIQGNSFSLIQYNSVYAVYEASLLACSDEDDSSIELWRWHKEMSAYEAGYKAIFAKYADKFQSISPEQLFFDVSYSIEGFQEHLEFYTSNVDKTLKISIR